MTRQAGDNYSSRAQAEADGMEQVTRREEQDRQLREDAGVLDPNLPDEEYHRRYERRSVRHEVDRDGYVRDRALSLMVRGSEPGWDDMDEDGRAWAFRYPGRRDRRATRRGLHRSCAGGQ